jgi:hypothetical protein
MSEGPSLSEIRRAVAGELVATMHKLDRIETRVDSVDGNVGRVSSDLQTTRAELLALRDEFQSFVMQAERTANVQRSETVMGNIEAALERDFGHYNVVRRTSIGLLQAFDIGNVSNKTAQQVSEELMIQSPKYWLAPGRVTTRTLRHVRSRRPSSETRERRVCSSRWCFVGRGARKLPRGGSGTISKRSIRVR